MIPWVREKFIERRAKWLASRGKKSTRQSVPSSPSLNHHQRSSSGTLNPVNQNSGSQRETHSREERTTVLIPFSTNASQDSPVVQEEQLQQQQQQPHVLITSMAGDGEIVVRMEALRAPTTMVVNACPVPIVAGSNGHHLPHHRPLNRNYHPFSTTSHQQSERAEGLPENARQEVNALETETRPLPGHHRFDDIRSRRSGAHGSQSGRSSTLSSGLNNQHTSSSNILNDQRHSPNASSVVVKERIKVRIISPSTRILSFQTENNKKLLELKNEVILELSDDMASMPIFAPDSRVLGPRFRLVKADYEGYEMNEQQTLAQLNIRHNDILVLVFKRNGLQQMVTQTRETRPPLEADIENATRHVVDVQNPLPLIDLNEIFQQSNLQFDVRKVLISLAQVSALILGVGPYANRLIAMLKQKLINKRNYQNDTAQCLVDMGFTRERAEYALRIHNNVYSTALEWLIARQSDDMTDKKIPTIPKSNSISSPSGIISNDNVLENTAALLEIVRIFSHRDIPPNPETVQSLMDMGFDEESVILALKKTCNNKASACEWLCGNRNGSLVELRDGLTDDSPILKTMIELPHVQLALGNPKTFLAFLTILENENTLRVWSSNETSSVITQILQKYHEEKHVLGINQFYQNR